MSEVKLLGNVAQELNGFLTADRSEDEWEPYDNPYSPSSSTYRTVPAQTAAQKPVEGVVADGYDCKREFLLTSEEFWNSFNPIDSIKYLRYCHDRPGARIVKWVALFADLMIAAGLTLVTYNVYMSRRIPKGPPVAPTGPDAKANVSERPAAEDKKELISAEDEKVIEALIEDLENRQIPDNDPAKILQKVVRILRGKQHSTAVKSSDHKGVCEFNGMPLFQAQARLVVAYFSIKNGEVLLSEVAADLSEAKQLFETAKNAATSPEDAAAIDGLEKITGRILHKVTEEDHRPIAAPGVLRGGAHESAGPKIDPELVRKAADGASWAIKQLMREVRKIDAEMTVARLAKMIRSNTRKDAEAIESFGLAGVDKPLLGRLAETLKGGARMGAHSKDEDRRGKNGPHGK